MVFTNQTYFFLKLFILPVTLVKKINKFFMCTVQWLGEHFDFIPEILFCDCFFPDFVLLMREWRMSGCDDSSVQMIVNFTNLWPDFLVALSIECKAANTPCFLPEKDPNKRLQLLGMLKMITIHIWMIIINNCGLAPEIMILYLIYWNKIPKMAYSLLAWNRTNSFIFHSTFSCATIIITDFLIVSIEGSALLVFTSLGNTPSLHNTTRTA